MKYPDCRPRFHPAAMSLVETIVAMALSSMLFLMIGSATVFSRFSLAAVANYADLEGQSRYVLDYMSRAIRESAGVAAFSSTSFTLTNKNGTQVRFVYNPDQRILSEIRASGDRVLLHECNSLAFASFQRNYVLADYSQVPASATNQGKLIQLNWVCSRTIMGSRRNTESVQSAKVVIRSK